MNETTYASQTKSPRFILALPHMINKSTDGAYNKLGNIPDLAQRFCDEFVRENGEKLMPCKSRDEVFGARLREATGQKYSRFEAYTIVRQTLGDEDGLVGTKRHVDGPNCTRVGYQTTCVFSFLCIWKDKKYRITFICYTRNSCGHWMNDNTIALHIRERIKDYIIQSNGDLRYDGWSLKDDMSRHKIRKIDNMERLVPPDESITDSVYQRRNAVCKWLQNKDSNKSIRWTNHEYTVEKGMNHKKISLKTKIIKVQEFVNRYGYVSSFAHGINVMSTVHRLVRTQVAQLVYAALLTPSQIQFQHVITSMREMEEGTYDETSNMFKEFYQKTNELGLKWGGGPLPRFQGQSDCRKDETGKQKQTELFQFESNDVLEKNLDRLMDAIVDLNSGSWLNDKKELVRNLASYKIKNVGNVGSLSFPSLCCFTGLCTSTEARITAKSVLPNMSKRDHSYLKSMKQWLQKLVEDDQIHVDIEEATSENKLKRMWKAIAKSLNEVTASIENATCAVFRGYKRYDIFFHRQSLYNLVEDRDAVIVKDWESDEWKVLYIKDGLRMTVGA